ncbi:MAG: hypothetical protein JWQ22_126 [Devosia sp.]|nr:hypothetical protein [Devosia sp.]
MTFMAQEANLQTPGQGTGITHVRAMLSAVVEAA